MSTWINGRARAEVDASDRGLQYGDGLFETMHVREGRIRLMPFHLERLLAGCRRLKLAAPGLKSLRRELRSRAAGCERGVLKLIVTRGSGARGYRPTGRERCTRILTLHELSRATLSALEPAVRVRVCATPVGLNPALAGLKTLNRLESVLARSEWRDQRIWEGLMRDVEGNVVSGTMSNVFLRRGSTLLTPRLDRCGVEGVMRRFVLQESKALRLRVWQGRLPLAALDDAEEMFLTNAVAGIVSVERIEHDGARIRFTARDTASDLRARLELE